MSYVSLNFLLFVGVTVLVYFLFPFKKQKWTVLLAASYVFYLLAGYKYAFFILFTTASTYGVARWLDRMARVSKEALAENKALWSKEEKKAHKARVKTKKRLVMTLALVANFGILAFLKYFNFFAEGINSLLGSFGAGASIPLLKLFLPLGMSFYTFQSMGYVVDVYREKVPAERNIAKLALFVSFFPQIIQGPIGIYDKLAHQLYEPHSFDATRFKHGAELILWGFFKKMVIADRAAIAINAVSADYLAHNGTTLTFIVLLYALQLYADFSAGIDISRGVAQILGIDMAENFRRPYFATSINDYWRRWHMSLGEWFKNYLFYPLAVSNAFLSVSKKMKSTKLGGTKAGAHIAKVLPTSVASLIVFFLVGVWHGANLKYVAFGLWNGGIIMVSILMEPIFVSLAEKLRIDTKSHVFRIFRTARTFLVVLVGYVFDVAPDIGSSMKTFKMAITDQNIGTGYDQIMGLGLNKADYLILLIGMLVIFVHSVIQERDDSISFRAKLDSKPFILRYILILAALVSILVFGIYGLGYNSADFVYMQF